MTSEQFYQILSVINHIDQVLTSEYSMVGFVVCVVLPVLGLVWFLYKFFSVFFREYL